ncbi:MAG: hypothetical protein WCN95_11645, partial [bacterium]
MKTHSRDFYVAVAGNDSNPGTSKQPFVTISRARDAVREWNKANVASNVTVWLANGSYELPETLCFGPEDSAGTGHLVTYSAMPGSKPVLSGGRRISGWKVSRNRWTVILPEVARGEWDFAQLFVNGKRRSRPRLPREGYHYIAGTIPSTPNCTEKWNDRFSFVSKELKATWTNLTDVEVLVFHEWATSRLRLSDVNEAECIATVAGGTHRGLNRGGRFLVENVKEALIPGEWYLDRKKGELTYLPLPGERLDKSVIIAPRHDRVLEIKGDVPGKKWVEGLCFSGLTFAHGNWTTPPNGNCIPQAESSMPAAVYAEGARNCTF